MGKAVPYTGERPHLLGLWHEKRVQQTRHSSELISPLTFVHFIAAFPSECSSTFCLTVISNTLTTPPRARAPKSPRAGLTAKLWSFIWWRVRSWGAHSSAQSSIALAHHAHYPWTSLTVRNTRPPRRQHSPSKPRTFSPRAHPPLTYLPHATLVALAAVAHHTSLLGVQTSSPFATIAILSLSLTWPAGARLYSQS